MEASRHSAARLRWRCRRGIKEMDVLLERFLRRSYPNLAAKEQGLFEKLLEEADLDLYGWIMERAEPGNPDYLPLVESLRQAAREGQR